MCRKTTNHIQKEKCFNFYLNSKNNRNSNTEKENNIMALKKLHVVLQFTVFGCNDLDRTVEIEFSFETFKILF